MPFLAQQQQQHEAEPPSPLSKKRRRDEEQQKEENPSLFSQNYAGALHINCNPSSFALNPTTRKIVPLPVNKRVRIAHEHDDNDNDNNSSSSSHAHPPPSLHHHRNEHEQDRSSSHNQTPYTTTASPSTASSPVILSPCHICHRKPTKKSELDSFADCLGCGQRTCFVCMRKCPGWLAPVPDDRGGGEHEDDGGGNTSFTMLDAPDSDNNDATATAATVQDSDHRTKTNKTQNSWFVGSGHHSMVCSSCCIERGPEGDVMCLGCLAGMGKA